MGVAILTASSATMAESIKDLHAIDFKLIEANGGKSGGPIHFSMAEPVTQSRWKNIGIPEVSGQGIKIKDYRSGYQLTVAPSSLKGTVDINVSSTHIVDIRKIITSSGLIAELPTQKKCSNKYTLKVGQDLNNLKTNSLCAVKITWAY